MNELVRKVIGEAEEFDPEGIAYEAGVPPADCPYCGADLNKEASVMREYVSKGEDLPYYLPGHYEGDYFEPDAQPAISLTYHDLADDSDFCMRCGRNLTNGTLFSDTVSTGIDAEVERRLQ